MSRRPSALGLALLLAAGQAAPAAAQGAAPSPAPRLDGPEREAAALADTLTHTRDPLVAAEAILRLSDRLPDLGQLPTLQQALEIAADRPQLAGEPAALAQRLGAALLIARGRPERAAELARALGLVQSALVLGPLDWNATQVCGIAGPVPPLDARPGPGGWRAFSDLAPLGRFSLDDLVSDRRDEAAVVAFSVKLAHAARAALYYGASAPTAVALNGRWVASDPTQHAERFGQARVALDLPAGESVIQVQLCRAERPLQLSLRLADERGRPLRGAALGLPSLPFAFPKPHGKPAPLRPAELGGLLYNLAQSHDDLEAIAVLTEQLALFDDRNHPPLRARAAACAAAPTVACYLQLDRDQQLAPDSSDASGRRAALDAAEALSPPDAESRAALELAEARYAADLGYPDRALRHAKAATTLDPDDSRAALALAQALEALGMTGLAGQLELSAVERWPESPAVLTAASYRLERLHREAEAILLLRRQVALRDDLVGAHEALQRLLLRQGSLDGALDQLAALRRLLPSSARTYLEEGKLLLANPAPGTTRHDRAEQAFAVALSLDPDDPDLIGEIAAAELREGATDRGRSLLSRALALAPQSPVLRALDEGASAHPAASQALPGTLTLKDLRQVAASTPPTPGADAVTLSDTTVVQVFASGLSSRVHQTIVRVQTERGAQAARTVPIDYSPDRQDLRLETARVLKPNGDLVPTYQESNRSLSEPWYDLYYDLREDQITFPQLAPGDVLEVTYRLDDSARENLIAHDFGDLVFLQDSVDRRAFEYAVVMPKDRTLFFNQPQLQGFAHTLEALPDGRAVHTFTARDVPRLPAEPQMPGYADVAPYLHVSTQNSWASVGDYFWALAKDQLQPSPQLLQVARTLEAQAGADPAARAAAAYDYVVSFTRYVGLEFGIHGYKPYPVGEVLARGFGDCKDKASLLVALLRELGVPGNLVLVRTRRQGNIGVTPASLSVFDHAIVYVPSLDRYLDGTARFYGSRELPVDDQGASALLIEPGGKSRLVVIPALPAAQNLTDTTLTFALRDNGAADIDGQSLVSGALAPEYRQAYASDVGQKSAFEAAWSRSYPGLSVQSLSFSNLTALEQPVQLTFKLHAPHLSEQPNQLRPFGLTSGYLETYAALSKRRYPLQLDFPFVTRFHYRCLPPPQRTLVAPPDVHLKTAFGALEVVYAREATGTLTVSGQLSIDQARVEPADYATFRDFLRRVDQAFETPIGIESTRPATQSKAGGPHAAR